MIGTIGNRELAVFKTKNDNMTLVQKLIMEQRTRFAKIWKLWLSILTEAKIPRPMALNTTTSDVMSALKSRRSTTSTSPFPLKISGVYMYRLSGSIITARTVLMAVIVTESARSGGENNMSWIIFWS